MVLIAIALLCILVAVVTFLIVMPKRRKKNPWLISGHRKVKHWESRNTQMSIGIRSIGPEQFYTGYVRIKSDKPLDEMKRLDFLSIWPPVTFDRHETGEYKEGYQTYGFDLAFIPTTQQPNLDTMAFVVQEWSECIRIAKEFNKKIESEINIAQRQKYMDMFDHMIEGHVAQIRQELNVP